MRRLGRQIVQLRDRRGMSQEDLAAALHLPQDRLDEIEQGQESPTLDMLVRIAISLKAEPWELLALPAGGSAPAHEAGNLHEYH